MEFTSDLSAFQGSIVSLNSIHGYSKITGRGGNEKKIEAVIKCLQDYMKEKKLDDITANNETKDKVRKIALYLVLNADLEILQELVELDEIGSVIWTVPTIPPCLLSDMLWHLNMDTFIYELIVFSSPQLSIQLADILIDNFKYFHPKNCFKNLKILVTACYRFVLRLLYFNYKDLEVTQAVNNFHICLKYFYAPPNARKLEILKRDEKYKYVGDNLHSLLLVLSECFSEYSNTQKLKPSDMNDVYEFTYTEGCLDASCQEIDLETSPKKDIKESIENCNVMLLDVLKELVMEVSVEIYCAWSEFEVGDKSMQQLVGELCYRVHNTLRNITIASEHPATNMLQQISCKPIDCMDIINEVDSDTIRNNIKNNNEDKNKWIKALLHRNAFLDDITLVMEIDTNLAVLDEADCCELFNICKDYLRINAERDDVQALLIRAFSHCSFCDKMKLLENQFEDGVLNDDLTTNQFSNMMTEVFNKLTMSIDTDLSDVLSIFLQSPNNVYHKIFNLACENAQQTNIMVKVMRYLEKFSQYYYSTDTDPCIITVTRKLMENNLEFDKMQNFINFVNQLKAAKIILGVKLLLLIIMPSLHSGLIKKNIMSIHMQLKLIIEAYGLDEIIEYRAPMLAMLAQVLDAVRWKINTFANLAPSTLELGLRLLELTLGSYSLLIPENEKTWLKVKLKNIHPLNMYYYRQLWNPPGDTFLEVVTGVRIYKEMDDEHLTTKLSQVLSSTVLQEWYQIWDNLKIFSRKQIFNIFHEALLLIAIAERNFHSSATWACLLYCYKNFTLVTKSHYLLDPAEEGQIINALQKFVALENFVDEEDIESFCNLVLPLFGYMAENLNNNKQIWLLYSDKVKNKYFYDTISNIFVKTSKSLVQV